MPHIAIFFNVSPGVGWVVSLIPQHCHLNKKEFIITKLGDNNLTMRWTRNNTKKPEHSLSYILHVTKLNINNWRECTKWKLLGLALFYESQVMCRIFLFLCNLTKYAPMKLFLKVSLICSCKILCKSLNYCQISLLLITQS